MKYINFKSLFLMFAITSCGKLSESVSETRGLGTPWGQIKGKMTQKYNAFQKGESVCIAKFDADKQKYRVYAHTGGNRCDKSLKSGYVPKNVISYDSNAFGKFLVEQKSNSAISVEMRYSGNKIFPKNKGGYYINKPLYGKGRCFLHPNAKGMLNTAASALKSRKGANARLIILDCYRPKYVSAYMYETIVNSGISNPRQWVAPKSFHNKGGAVDLTWGYYDQSSGLVKPVDMGSQFDSFSPASKYNFPGVTEKQRQNRSFLRQVMKGAGFEAYDGEWWDFRTGNANEEFLDLPL